MLLSEESLKAATKQDQVCAAAAPCLGPDEGDASRRQPGLAIVVPGTGTLTPAGYQVLSLPGNSDCVVSPDAAETCFQQEADFPFHLVKLTKPRYSRDWPLYNAAQTNEKADFLRLLAQLCGSIQQPPGGEGRPRSLLSDMVFAAVYKVYSLVSSRRFTTDMRDAHARGYVSHPPHYNTISKYLADPDLTHLLMDLVHVSSLPMKHLESSQFATDSSGFSTRRFVSWYNKKYRRVMDNREWVKMHLICGTKTHIVTEVIISGWEAHDTTFFEPLLERTARHFNVEGVSADKAYSSRHNLHVSMLAGVVPYIPFKSNTVVPPLDDESAWAEMYHYFRFNQQEFREKYGGRNSSETTFDMMKTKYGGSLFSKSTAGQVNEAICKVLCHNLVEVSRALRYGKYPRLDQLSVAAI